MPGLYGPGRGCATYPWLMLERLVGGIDPAVLSRRLVCCAATTGVTIALGAAFVGSARSASVDLAAPSPGGVFVVTYAPQRVTSGDSLVRVSFTTTGRAQPGWEYYVYLLVEGRKPSGDKKARCAWRAASWIPSMVKRVQHISGTSGGSYAVWLRAARTLGGHFCAGQALLEVGTAPIGHQGDRRRLLRQVTLRIVPGR
jgi:hypothetical protein